MECKKICYFSELKKNVNVVLTTFFGTLLALLLFVIDKFNMPNLVLKKFEIDGRFGPTLISLCYAGLISVIALIVLALFFKLFSKKVDKGDGLLVAFDSFSLVSFIAVVFGLNEGIGKVIFVIILLVLAIFFTVMRFVKIKEESESVPVNTIEYRVAFAKKFNFPLLVILAVLVGVALGIAIYCIDFDEVFGTIFGFWQGVSKFEKIGYVVGIGISLVAGFNLYTIIGNRGLKFGKLDGFLLFGTIVSFFAGLAFAIDFDRPIWNFHLWGFIVSSFAFSTIVRALFVNCDIEENDYGKSTIYFKRVLTRYSLISVLAISLALTGLFINLDIKGLNNAFFNAGNAVSTVLLIIILLSLLITSLISLIRNGGFKAQKAIAFDYLILIGLTTGSMMLFGLYYQPTFIKLIIWIICFIICVVFLLVRIALSKQEEIISQIEEIEETEEETEEEVEEEIEETEESEIEESEEVEDEDIEETSQEISEVEEGLVIKAKRTTFINKVKFTSNKTKDFYSQLKNKLLSYGCKNRLTRRNEQFRKSGLIAKISVSGKTIRLHLPLDPNDLEKYPLTKYHQVDLSSKKQFVDVPFTIKIKSDRALKRALLLIDEVCGGRNFRKKRNFVEYDFTQDLDIDGSAIFEKLGCSDRLVTEIDEAYLEKFKTECSEELEKMALFIPSIHKEESSEGETQNIYIDTVLPKLDGDIISLETLKKENIISKATNNICVKIHSNLDKKIVVVCDEISVEAMIAVLAVGGKVFLTK